MRLDTPPESPSGSCTNQYENNEIVEEFDEDEFEYIGELDDGNIDSSSDDDVIYMPPPIDLAKYVFKQHTDAVFCGKFSPTSNLAVTGGQDDKAYVWNTETCEVVFECTGHNESVIEVAFSADGNFVATADMDGNVKVWKVATGKLHDEYSTENEIIWMFWHPGGNILFAGCSRGDTYVWRLPMTEFKMLYGHGHQSSCGSLLPDGKKLAVGYGDGSVKVWDLKNSKSLFNIKHATSSPVTCIDCYNDNNLIAAGYDDGTSDLIKISNGTIVGTLAFENSGSIESVKFGFGITNGILVTGAANELVLWDIAKQSVRTSTVLSEHDGVSHMVWKTDGLLYVGGTYSGAVYVFDGRSGREVTRLTGHKEMVLDVSLSKDESKLLTCSNDRTARIFDISSTNQ